MNLLLASLRRVEIRIEPQTITEFQKWKNRMADYNRGSFPEGVTPPEEETNFYLRTEAEAGEGVEAVEEESLMTMKSVL